MLQRPDPSEYNPYFARYIDLVPEGDVAATLERQMESTAALLRGMLPEKATYRYAEGKWSVSEVVGHMADTERVMAYRLLRIARGDRTPLAGFDQDSFVRNAAFDAVPPDALIDEYMAVRRSTLSLFRTVPPDAWTNAGTANNAPVTARALAYVIAGHELHHANILRETYL